MKAVKGIISGDSESISAAVRRIPFADVTLPTAESAKTDLERMAAQLCAQFVPQFKGSSDVSFEYFCEGITNKLLCVSLRAAPDTKALVRVFGTNTEFVIDRDAELVVLLEHPAAPTLFARFANGYLCSYSPGRTLAPNQIHDPRNMRLVARAIARVHLGNAPSLPRVCGLFDAMHAWLDNIPERYATEDKQALIDSIGK